MNQYKRINSKKLFTLIAISLALFLSLYFVLASGAGIVGDDNYTPRRVIVNNVNMDIASISREFDFFDLDESSNSLTAYMFVDSDDFNQRANANNSSAENIRVLYEAIFIDEDDLINIDVSYLDADNNLVESNTVTASIVYLENGSTDAILESEDGFVMLSEILGSERQDSFFFTLTLFVISTAKIVAAVKTTVVIGTVVVGGVLLISVAIRSVEQVRRDARTRVLTDTKARSLRPGTYPVIIERLPNNTTRLLILPVAFRTHQLAVQSFIAVGSGGGTYSATLFARDDARSIARDAGGGRPPVHVERHNGGFRHYHAHNRTPAGHAWYGFMVG